MVELLAKILNIEYVPPSSLTSSTSGLHPATGILSFIITACVVFLIALFVREIACWYWKINDIKKLLEDIKKNTQLDVNKPKPLNEPNKNS